MQRTRIIATGSALPTQVVTNKDLEKRIDTSDEWIAERTGIRQRHIAQEGETTASMATQAAQRALDMAGLQPADIDFVIVGTASPDYSFPSVAAQVQGALGLKNGAAFDLQAACSGFLYALTTADALMRAGHGRKALVIGAEVFSKLVDWQDRSTAVLFGDGAGAVIASLEETDDPQAPGLLASAMHSDGQHVDLLRSTGGIGSTGTIGSTLMNGREVFRHAVRAMADIVPPLLEKAGLEKNDITWLVPHQANKRIIDATARHLELEEERVILTVDKHANTSAASIPLALDWANRQGRFKAGDILFLDAFGAGFTWAGALVRW